MGREAIELIGSIYDCTLDAAKWPEALDRIRAAVRGYNASLSVNDLPSGANLRNIAVNIPDPYMTSMVELAPHAIALWGDAARLAAYPMLEPYRLSDVADPNAMRTNPYVLDWAQPQGICDAAGMLVAREPDMIGSVAFGRHKDVGSFDLDDLALLRLLAPHLRRAVSINHLLDFKTIQAATLEAVLDGSGSAVLIVDPKLTLVHANRLGRAELDRRTLLFLRHGALQLADRKAAMRLARALAEAGGAGGGELSSLAIPARGSDGSPVVIHLLPLRFPDLGTRGRPGAVAALFIAPAARQAPTPIAALSELYELTAAEARVAELIADGLPLADAARRIGISPVTVRTHLLRVFQKTGQRRQADLAALVRSFAAPGPPA